MKAKQMSPELERAKQKADDAENLYKKVSSAATELFHIWCRELAEYDRIRNSED